MNLFDINITDEDLALMLLNNIYGYNLVNLNYEKKNIFGIDFGDRNTGIAFQVTSRTDAGKTEENLKMFVNRDKRIYPKGIRFFILSPEVSKIERLKNAKFRVLLLPISSRMIN